MRMLAVVLLMLPLAVAACVGSAQSGEMVPIYGLTPTPRDLPNSIDIQGGWAVGGGPTPTPIGWVPAYKVTPTPPLFPTPTPTPVRPSTTIVAQCGEVALGQSVTVSLVAKGLAQPVGLREYDVEISFDPRAVRVTEVTAAPAFADPQLGSTLFHKLDPQQGRLLLVAYRNQSSGDAGELELAYLTVTGLKAGVWPLEVTIHTLEGTDGRVIPAAGEAGTLTVRRTR